MVICSLSGGLTRMFASRRYTQVQLQENKRIKLCSNDFHVKCITSARRLSDSSKAEYYNININSLRI